MNKVNFTPEQIQNIIELYVEKHTSMAKIGLQYGVSKTVIKRVLTEQQIEIRKDNHTYQADYNKFTKIDSVEKAYWLGFIAADGCVFIRDENASIILNIQEKDIGHLEKLKKFMNGNMPIKTHVQNEGFSNNTPMCTLTFNSKTMAQDFVRHGVPNKKSLVLQPPLIDEQYYLPYILGYFDGDGSIFELTSGEWGINFEGTKEILEWINNLLKVTTHLEQRNNNGKNNFYIRCGGYEKPYQIMKKLYDSCSCHLDRKYQKFEKLQLVVSNRNIRNN